MRNNSEGCKTSSDNVSSISSSMHSRGMEVDDNNFDDSTFGEKVVKIVPNAGVIVKEKHIASFGILDDPVVETAIADDVESFEEISATMPNEAIEDYTKKSTPQDIATAIGIKSSNEKGLSYNSTFITLFLTLYGFVDSI